MAQTAKNRKDHILPQGYLDGFTGQKGLLQVFHIEERRWFSEGTAGVAWGRGFYDYSDGVNPDQTADEAFREFEGKFPEVRRDLIDANFTNWRSHLDFLLRYINMFRVRSKIYRSHVLKLLEEKPPMVIDQILDSQPHPTEPGKFIQKMTVKPMEQTGDELMTAFNDLSISKMRADMQEVPKLFSDLKWCLRYTIDANKPVITCDEAIRFESPDPKLADPSRHLDTVLYFPICWQACLIGRPHPQMPHTRIFSPNRLRELEGKYLASHCRFAYSPVELSP